jgi:membrane protein DedA with SNARE-associated domain
MSFDLVLELLMLHKYSILFPVLVIEGPVATILASFLASPAGGNILNIVAVFFIVLFADIFGDTMYYVIGRYGAGFFTDRYPRQFSFSPERLARIEKYYRIYGAKTIAIGKVSHGLGWPIMVGAGSAKMNYQKFVTINAIVSIVKSFVLVAAGYYYGDQYESLVAYFGRGTVLVTTAITVVAVYLIFRNITKNRELE